MPPLAIFGAIAAAGSIGGAAIGASAAGKAANAQANAANYAATLQKQAADEALAFQKQQYADQQRILQPYIQTGQGANLTLRDLMGITLPQSVTSSYPTPQATLGPPPDPSSFFSKAYSDAVGQYGQKAISQNDSLLDPFRQRAQQEYDNAKATYDQQTAPVNPQTGNAPVGTTGTPGGAWQVGPDGQLINPTDQNLAKAGMTSTTPGFGSLAQGFTEQFQAPGAEGLNEDPGFQARLKLGNQAIERSAAAKGNVLGGGTLKDLMGFNSDQASQEYGNVYNRRMNEYLTRANLFNQNQTNLFNRYSALSGTGQVSANQLGLLGSNAANNVSNTLLTSAGQIGNDITGAANARASGYVGGANAYGGAISNIGSNLLDLYALSKILPKK